MVGQAARIRELLRKRTMSPTNKQLVAVEGIIRKVLLFCQAQEDTFAQLKLNNRSQENDLDNVKLKLPPKSVLEE